MTASVPRVSGDEAARKAAEGEASEAEQALSVTRRNSQGISATSGIETARQHYARAELLFRALAERARLAGDDRAADERRFLALEASVTILQLSAELHWLDRARYPEPTDAGLTEADGGAQELRALFPHAGTLLVDIINLRERLLDDAFEQSGGKRGMRQPAKPDVGSGERPVPVRRDIPALVEAGLAAREYFLNRAYDWTRAGGVRIVGRVDLAAFGKAYLFEIGDTLYRYGHFPEAKTWLSRALEELCAETPRGYDAWLERFLIASAEDDEPTKHELARILQSGQCAPAP